ncbi:hypothetical protein RHMOL_Rhmol07G0084900 [Rhododendron molle]|uniref:Uncharacterized protein n=1 Tax=Rhododendron molle TaxID=49168 RepID=A0ACC0N0I9_RHOML|nr:hypothetical protein RHMOL_Rhmol07G0084900 [Rhododendron molle]
MGTGHVVLIAHLSRSNVFWTVQICLGLRGCFDNFILKDYPNIFGPSKTRLNGRDACSAPHGPCPPSRY